MNIKNIRYILWILIFFFFFLLFNSWENEKSLNEKIYNNINFKDESEINSSNTGYNLTFKDDKNLIVETDLISAQINLNGGDLVFLSLKKYSKSIDNNDSFIILDNKENFLSFIKTGFFSDFNKKENINLYNSNFQNYYINKDNLNLYINLEYKNDKNIIFNKIYVFRNYSYDIDLNFYVRNNGNDVYSGRHYGFLKHNNIFKKNSFFDYNLRTYEGVALYTNKKPYKKISFDELNSNSFSQIISGGWLAFMERYFISSIIPDFFTNHIYSVENENNFYILKYITESDFLIYPGDCYSFENKFYIGPKIKDFLSKMGKGLDLSIDYGIFWPIATPLFMMLKKTFDIFENWGLSIIFVTIMIKLLFFHLSSMSYNSMQNMKRLQPRINLLKERYKDDKKQFNNAMLDLYKKEKINPLSGCFPILIQIPVFISLYYVLLESVELRHSPFIFWINDLSSKDTYYVLPVIMCITMFIQQKLNPQVQDATYSKFMNFIPFIFLILFLQFPSGLILYWVLNNILSILQQHLITKRN